LEFHASSAAIALRGGRLMFNPAAKFSECEAVRFSATADGAQPVFAHKVLHCANDRLFIVIVIGVQT
jgi:hypothetical protein